MVTSLLRAGDELWSGTEEGGVSRLRNGQWVSYTAKDGLGDNSVYALATDRLGRVWVGHRNHGVSVWNGRAWKNYGVTDGPLGERVFAIATSPVDGDVWIAHNAGLTRYSLKRNTWTHYTRANGLPTIEISSLAFEASGRLWIGTQHDGLLVGAPGDDFARWQHIKGATTLPTQASGAGLPCNFINDVVVSAKGAIFVATNAGLAHSEDKGATWKFARGRDWAAKAASAGAKLDTQVSAGQSPVLLAEDAIEDLALGADGSLWIGYARSGYEVRRTDSASLPLIKSGASQSHVSAIAASADGGAALGIYGVGIEQSVAPQSARPGREVAFQKRKPNGIAREVPFPSVAGAPSSDELRRLTKLVREHRKADAGAPALAALPSDWTTQGDWRGRYGRYWALLGAMMAPRNYTWGAGDEPVYLETQLGPGARKGDRVRSVVKSLYSDDRSVLEMPSIYFDSRLVAGKASGDDASKNRRASAWSDGGEKYPATQEGPGLYVTVKVPKGKFVLSFYNRDGGDGVNTVRDYAISVRPHDYRKPLHDVENFDQTPEWASSRQRDFRGGEWKKYAVKGPQDVTIKVGRNYSTDTILAGLFLDEINEQPKPYFDIAPAEGATNGATLQTVSLAPVAKPQDWAADDLWAALNEAQTNDPLWWASESRIFYQVLLRHYDQTMTSRASAQTNVLWERLGTCYYQLNLYPQWERMQEKRGLQSARATELALKWDKLSSFDGMGRQTIKAFRAGTSITVAVDPNQCSCHSEP